MSTLLGQSKNLPIKFPLVSVNYSGLIVFLKYFMKFNFSMAKIIIETIIDEMYTMKRRHILSSETDSSKLESCGLSSNESVSFFLPSKIVKIPKSK